MLMILVVTLLCVAAASGSHDGTNPTRPPRIRRMVDEYYRPYSAALVQQFGTEADRMQEYKGDLQKQTEQYMDSGKLRSGIILFAVAVTLICAAKSSGSHGYTNPPPLPPPPPIRDMLYGYYAGKRQAREEDLHSRLDAVVSLLQQVVKGLDQILQEMSNRRKTPYDYEHPGQEAAGQAQTMDEGTGPTYKLRFHGSLKARIYTKKPLLEQSDETIEIAIYRDGQIITSGDLSSVRVEIVALESNHTCKGSWTEEDFHRQIQMRRGGQGSVLEGDRSVKLVNGKASLGNVWFIEGSSGTRSREFVLAARIDMSEKIEGLRVEEAFMQPSITVLVERSEANEKSVIPMLNDKVHRLNEIARVYSQRLEQKRIRIVQDFLKALNKDENELRQILIMKSDKSWNVLVGHARKCDLRDEHELKPYMVEGENVILFFNCIHDNVGAEFNGRYIAKDKFDPVQKALVDRLKKQAYNELDGIDFQYVMKDNRPVKISANVNAGGSSSIPMSGASLRNTSDHHAHAESQVEKLSPSGIGPVPESDLPLGGANCNAAGPRASEPSPDQHYAHQNQGVAENSVPEGDDIRPGTATTDVDLEALLASFVAPIPNPNGPDSDPSMPGDPFQISSHDKFSANVNAGGSSSIPMSGASPRNTSDHHAHAVSQAVEKLGPSGIGPEPEPDLRRGGANCNAAGPSPPDQHYTHQSQGVAENSVPEEDAIRPDTATTDVDWLDQLAWTIRTPYGPDSDPLMPTEDQSQIFWANHRSFGEFWPPEDQSQNFWPAPSGGGGN